MRILIFVLCFLFSNLSIANVQVLFVNGIDGDPKKNLISAEKIRTVLTDSGFIAKFGGARADITTFPNPGDGFLDDKIELLEQSVISAAALTLAKVTEPAATAQSPLYKAILGRMYSEAIATGAGETETKRHIYSVIKDLRDNISREIFTKGGKLIVVGHSQANFFTEAVDAYLRYGLTAEQNRTLDANLRFVGVASVAASTPNSRYISASEDFALNRHAEATLIIPNFSLLPRNVELCTFLEELIPGNPCLSRIRLLYDFFVHGFREIYTSDLLDKNTSKSLARIVADLISVSFDEIVFIPPTPLILDQRNDQQMRTSFGMGPSVQWQQGITVGITGKLSAIELFFNDVSQFYPGLSSGAVEVSINRGFPWVASATVVATITPVPGVNRINLSALGLVFNAGDQITLGLRGIGDPNVNFWHDFAGTEYFNPAGNLDPYYPRGFLYVNGGPLRLDIGFDMGFRTFVEARATCSSTQYTITDLGLSVEPRAINDSAQITGIMTSAATGQTHAFLYSNSVLRDLGRWGGATYSQGFAIDSQGRIAGIADIGNSVRGVRYSNETITDLGTLGGNSTLAYGTNDQNQIVGASDNLSGSRAFIRTAGSLQDLGTPSEWRSAATDINNAGLVVGFYLLGAQTRAFLYTGGNFIDLTLGGTYSYATAINDVGDVVGQAETSQGTRTAFLYRDRVMLDLGIPNGFAVGINNCGQIVVDSGVQSLYYSGVTRELSTLLPANSGWTLTSVRAINNLGYIVGTGHYGGSHRGFLMIPSN